MVKWIYFPLGVCFGFILIKSGVSNYDVIRDMFLVRSWHLYGVLCIAVGTTFLLTLAIKKFKVKALLTHEPIDLSVRVLTKDNIIGGLIGGLGWALTGACPGPALAQIGFGTLSGLFTVIGIFIGVYAHGVRQTE